MGAPSARTDLTFCTVLPRPLVQNSAAQPGLSSIESCYEQPNDLPIASSPDGRGPFVGCWAAACPNRNPLTLGRPADGGTSRRRSTLFAEGRHRSLRHAAAPLHSEWEPLPNHLGMRKLLTHAAAKTRASPADPAAVKAEDRQPDYSPATGSPARLPAGDGDESRRDARRQSSRTLRRRTRLRRMVASQSSYRKQQQSFRQFFVARPQLRPALGVE